MARLVLAGLLCACTSAQSAQPVDAGADDASYDPHPQTPAWLSDAHVFTQGHNREDVTDCRTRICRHNENVDTTSFGGALYMVHRTARSQVLGDDSSLHVFKATDGTTFTDIATLPAIVGRDLRDPSLFVVGDTLFLKAITRLPVNSARDSSVESISVITTTKDGVAWTPFENAAPPTWSFWRVKANKGTWYSAAYQDGDKSVSLFSSPDGHAWTQGAQIYGIAADTPLETELVFMPSDRLLALVRMDGTDDELLGYSGRLRTKVCWSMPPYATWDCPQELTGQRLDGPVAFFWQSRLFVVARKHLQDGTGRKRTSLFELTGTLEGGPIDIKEWGELPSGGDTSYAGIGMIDASRAVVHWYSGDIVLDKPWLVGMFDLTDVWQATIDLTKLK